MVTTRRASVAKASIVAMPKSKSKAPVKAVAQAVVDGAAKSLPRVLKKYPNRRLYDTETSSYITLADVKKMVMAGQVFVVRDAKTADDLTRSILLQIILEEETGGVPMFSSQSLAQIIRFYGQAMQGVMGSYLEHNLQAFTEIQARMTEQSKGLFGTQIEPQAMSPELWTKFLAGQAPAVQGLMGNYLEQSKNMFTQMQEQMTKQAGSLFPAFVPTKR